jgi:hypothetical protein
MVVETHVIVLPFWHMLLLKNDHNQPNGPMKAKGCDVRLKCKIRMANYK